jgi:hypothetical protein
LQKNVAFVKQWLSQNAAYKPDLQYFFEERFAYAGWTGDVEMLEITDRKDVVKVLSKGQNSMLILAFMNLHLEFAESVMAIDGAIEGGKGTQLPFNREDWIALFTAVNGDPDMVKLLAWAAGSFRFVTGDSPPILLSVACPANLDTIRTLVRLGWGIRGVSDYFGLTAMHYAARVPNVETLKFLKRVGLNINAEARGWRPVYEATRFGHVENIQWFKQAGARITDPDSYGINLMHVAAENSRLSVIEYLQEIGESLSVRDSRQNTPLHFAVRGGDVGVVRYLVEKGVDVNAANSNGSTPMHDAVDRNRPEVVRVLSQELGANLTLKNRNGKTAFDLLKDDQLDRLSQYFPQPPSAL